MALTLRQQANLRNGKALDDATITLLDAIDEGVRQLSAEIMRGNITVTDTLIAPSGCTQTQLAAIAERGLRGSVTSNIMSALTGDAAFITAGVAVTDLQITNAAKRQIGFYAKWVGTTI